MISFKGKKIMVTGASSGIGREVCIQLSELGACVVLIARDENRLKETLSLMQGSSHQSFSYDLNNSNEIKDLVAKAVEYNNEKFDGFVHAAGIVDMYPLKTIDWEKFEHILKINTYSYLELIKYLSKKQYTNDNASFLFASSTMTKVPTKANTTYIVSKAAGESMAKALSLELIRRGIRVNNLLIGPVATKMMKDTEQYRELANNSEQNNLAKHHYPISKILSPREVSNMVMFLLSSSAKYIIGESYYIDGGWFP